MIAGEGGIVVLYNCGLSGYICIKDPSDAGMTDRDGDTVVQVQDLENMRFRPEFQSEITRWISNISTLNWTVVNVQKSILHKFRSYVPGLRELLQPAFTDSESLNIPCTLDKCGS